MQIAGKQGYFKKKRKKEKSTLSWLDFKTVLHKGNRQEALCSFLEHLYGAHYWMMGELS